LAAHLAQLSPLKILDRGYAIVERDGKIVKTPADAPVGSAVRVRLAAGELAAKVIAPTERKINADRPNPFPRLKETRV